MTALEKAFREQAQMGVELRRDVYGKFGAISSHVEVFKAEFGSMETLLDAKVTEIDLKLELLHRREGGGATAHERAYGGRRLQ